MLVWVVQARTCLQVLHIAAAIRKCVIMQGTMWVAPTASQGRHHMTRCAYPAIFCCMMQHRY